MPGNNWERSELLVMETLKRIERLVEENSKDIMDLKLKAASWGFAAGILSAGAWHIVEIMMGHGK